MTNKKDILFIGATHGDEPIGLEVLCEIRRRYPELYFDFIIGNPRALQQAKGWTDYNLNRAAPGDPGAREYEKRRAYEVLEMAKSYRYIVDLHGTKTKTGIFIIITNPKKENFYLASLFNIKRIVIWPSISSELVGPLSEFFNCGLEIESGPKTSTEVKNKLVDIIVDFLENYKEREKRNYKKILASKEIFEVYGSLKENKEKIKLEEFKEAQVNGENFYPLLIGGYDDLVCYKMKKVNINKIL